MERFPEQVRNSMSQTGAATTCATVQLDDQAWETAVFFQLAGPECKKDRKVLSKGPHPIPLGIETDLIEHPSAAIVVLRLEVYTDPDDPLVGEVLFTPGHASAHFETLQTLAKQPRLCWFFCDQTFWIIHRQQHPLDSQHHEEFVQLLGAAVKHDALIRLTSRYDANAALREIVANYELRAGTTRLVRPPDGQPSTKN